MNQRILFFFAGCFMSLCLIVSLSQVFASQKESRDISEQTELPPPAIFSPADRSEIRGIFKMSFSWSKVQKAAGYHIVLSRDRRFSRIVYENDRISDSACIVDNLDYGTYFFRISSVSSDGREGPFSETRTFIIAPSPPIK